MKGKMLIRTNTRKDIVRRQKMIINHVDRKSRTHDGTSPVMRSVMKDYEKVCRDGKLLKSRAVLR